MTEQRVRERPVALAPFATFERGRGLVELRCRCCNTPIGKVLPVGEQKVRQNGTRTVVETGVQFCYLEGYREIEIEQFSTWEDEAKPAAERRKKRHVGCVCADCATRLENDSTLLASFCETDLAQWRSEGHQITERMDTRPTRVLRVARQIKD